MVIEKREVRYTLSYKIEANGTVLDEVSISCLETENEEEETLHYVKDFKQTIRSIRLTHSELKRKRGGIGRCNS